MTKAKANLIGSEQFLIAVPLPVQTDTYTVISHEDIIQKVENELNNANLKILDVEYTYRDKGEIALAKVYIESTIDKDMGMLFTWQNSYNKKVKFSCAIGGYIYDNRASLIGTEGLSWIRKHTGTAKEEAFGVIQTLIDMAHQHFAKVISEKNRMKAQELTSESYGHVMGALYFEHDLLNPTQASAVKQEYEKPTHKYSDMDTLWGLYKMLMFGIENAHILKWQSSQQKLHHLIMAEYAIATEPNTLADVNFDILDNSLSNSVIGPDVTPIGPRVVVEENEDGDPLVSAQAVMIDYSAKEQLADAMVAPLKSGNPLPLSTLSDNLPQKEDEEFDWKTEEEPEIRMVDPQTEEQKVAEYNETHDDSQMIVEYLSIKELEERYPDHLRDDQITAIEEGLDHNDPEIHIESDEEYAKRVAIIEGEPEEIQDELQDLLETVEESNYAGIGTEHLEEVVEEPEDDPFVTDEEEDEVMDAMLTPIPVHHEPLIPTQEELDAEHVGPPEMYQGDAEESSDLLSQVESSVEETSDATDLFGGVLEEEVVEVDEDNLVEDPIKLAEEVTGVSTEVEKTEVVIEVEEEEVSETISKEVEEELAEEPVDFAALANKYSEEELNEPVPIIPPTINLPKEKEVIRSQQPATTKEAFKEEENFLDVTEYEGLTVPEGMIENAAVIEKKMILLYGSVRPYQMEECSGQLNVTIEDTYESFYVSV